MTLLLCSMCGSKFPTSLKLLYHVKKMHRSDPRFSLRCSLCEKKSKSFRTFYRHFKEKHGIQKEEKNQERFAENTNNEDSAEAINDNSLDLQIGTAKTVLLLKEKYLLSEEATNFMVEEMQNLIELHIENIKAKMINNGINIDDFEDALNYEKAFLGLHNQGQRERKFSSMFEMFTPQEVVLGSSLIWKMKKRVPQLEEVKCLGYYFPFLNSLKRILSNKDFEKAATARPLQTNSILKDVNDGQYYKNHKILCKANSLAIVAYYDDVELTNPLGSKTKKQKIGIFYWYIANIDPIHRSRLSAINLLAVTKTRHIRKFGVETLLKNFLHDLNKLENGYEIELQGKIVTLKGALLAFPSDTLASNFIGGFKESPSFSFRPCRFCDITKLNMKDVYTEKEVVLRDAVKHKEQVSTVTNTSLTLPAKKYWSKMYGIVSKSPLQTINNFDLTKCLVIDIMHILFEGVILHHIKLFMAYCLGKKFFSLTIINSRMQAFNFIGGTHADFPSDFELKVIKDPIRKINQNAAQSWQLLLMLPFLIEDLIPDQDDKFPNFLDLIKIVNLCVSFEVSYEDIALLERLIHIYLATFSALYGKRLIIPKMHYLIHLPRQILMFGPPRYLWCFRFEAKHFRVKSSAVISRNFKNVCLTIAKRLEALACLENLSSSEFLSKNDKVHGSKIVSTGTLASYVNIPLKMEKNKIVQACSVICDSILYKIGFYILYNKSDDSNPTFLCIRHIYIYDEKKYLVCQEQFTERFNKNVNAYVVRETEIYLTLNVKLLQYKHPVHAVMFQKKIHIVPKHYNCIEFDYM